MTNRFVESILSRIFDPLDIENFKLFRKVFSYEELKDITNDIYFVYKDIVSCNEKINNLIKLDIFTITRIDWHLEEFKAEPENTKLLYWVSDNGKILENENLHIQEFIRCSSILCKEFNKLKKFKKKDTKYNFNIRILQPYITNIIAVRQQLLKML